MQAPPRLRLLGLLAVAQGAACGSLFALASRKLQTPIRHFESWWGVFLAYQSFAATAGLWWNAHAGELFRQHESSKESVLAMRMLAQIDQAGADSAEAREFRESLEKATRARVEQLEHDRTLGAWLEHRISSISSSAPLAYGVFILELILAGIAARVMLLRQARKPYCDACRTWRIPIREQEFAGDNARAVAELVDRLDSSATVGSIGVQLLNCRCDGRRPDVLCRVLDESGNPIGKRSSEAKPVELNNISFERLVSEIDAAQGVKNPA